MPRALLLVPVLVLAACFGCQKPPGSAPTSAPAAPASAPGVPVQAQGKLTTVKLWLGTEEMRTELAATIDQVRTGMMFRTNMPENESMLFDLFYPQQAGFWMTNCPLPLSVAYIDPEGVILEIHPLQANDANTVTSRAHNVRFALETRQGWFERHHVGPGTLLRTERGTLMETFPGNH